MHIDRIDRKILALLQRDATLSAAQIGAQVGLSQSQCWRHIDQLEKQGVIVNRITVLDPKKVGLNITLFAQVKLTAHGRNALPEFSRLIQAIPEVLECHAILGNFDFLLRIVTPDIQAYERLFFDRLSRLPMVQEVNTWLSVSQVKSTQELPLDSAPMQ